MIIQVIQKINMNLKYQYTKYILIKYLIYYQKIIKK